MPQRPPVGPPPSWLPSVQVMSVLLVGLLVLLATVFQTSLAPEVASETAIPAGSPLEGTPDAVGIGDSATEAGALALASPTAAGTRSVGVGVGADLVPLLPEHRIVAFYGHPNDVGMGIVGQFGKEELLEHLMDEVDAYERADSSRQVMPAIEIVFSVAQLDPGLDGKYILHTDDATMREYIEFTQEHNILLLIDIQFGKSTVQEEMALLEDYLAEPNVHLAIDPEFAWGRDRTPGVDLGSVDADIINYAQEELARIVEEHNLPPKVLIVHRFTDGMVRNIDDVDTLEEVQFVLNFDGFGDPASKQQGYDLYVRAGDVPFGGIKLFYDQDRPLMQPDEVIELNPAPDYVMYQ